VPPNIDDELSASDHWCTWMCVFDAAMNWRSENSWLRQRNRKFLREIYLASFAGEVGAFPEATAHDFEAHVPPSLPWGGVHRGPDEFVNVVLPQLAVAFDFGSMHLESISRPTMTGWRHSWALAPHLGPRSGSPKLHRQEQSTSAAPGVLCRHAINRYRAWRCVTRRHLHRDGQALYSVLFRRWHWFHVFIGVATGGCSINSLCIVIGCRRVYYLVFDGVTVNTDIWAPTTDDER
jgi:hypothetical protein